MKNYYSLFSDILMPINYSWMYNKYIIIYAELLWMVYFLSGTLFSSDENKKTVFTDKDSVSLNITHMENFQIAWKIINSQFSDISMPRNYHKYITRHEIIKSCYAWGGCCLRGTFFSSDENKSLSSQNLFLRCLKNHCARFSDISDTNELSWMYNTSWFMQSFYGWCILWAELCFPLMKIKSVFTDQDSVSLDIMHMENF